VPVTSVTVLTNVEPLEKHHWLWFRAGTNIQRLCPKPRTTLYGTVARGRVRPERPAAASRPADLRLARLRLSLFLTQLQRVQDIP